MTKEELKNYLLGSHGDVIINIYPTTKGIKINRIASGEDSLLLDPAFSESWNELSNAELKEILTEVLTSILG